MLATVLSAVAGFFLKILQALALFYAGKAQERAKSEKETADLASKAWEDLAKSRDNSERPPLYRVRNDSNIGVILGEVSKTDNPNRVRDAASPVRNTMRAEDSKQRWQRNSGTLRYLLRRGRPGNPEGTAKPETKPDGS